MSIRKSRLTGLFTLHLKQIFIIRKYFTALLTVNRAFYLPFYEKGKKALAFSGAMWYDYVCVIGVQGESMPTNTVQAVSPYYNPTIEEVSTVPNIKSAKKRVKVAAAKTLQNKMINSQLKTEIKKANVAIESNAADKAEAVKVAVKRIDQAAAKGILHKNTAARKKSALDKKLNAGA